MNYPYGRWGCKAGLPAFFVVKITGLAKPAFWLFKSRFQFLDNE